MAERLRRTLKARVRKSVGSIPTECIFFFFWFGFVLFWLLNGGVAQMVERSVCIRKAQGSIPCSSIFYFFIFFFLFFFLYFFFSSSLK
jgi:hypothetical protein